MLLNRFKERLKHYRNSNILPIRWVISILIALYRAFSKLKQLVTSPEYRSACLTRLFHPMDVHQTTPLTFFDRYPDVFSECVRYFSGKENLRLLSFGCSTGEEVLTLRRYFPSAQIYGAEINRRSLRICRSRQVDDNISFIYSTAKTLENTGPFDAIFCMAVLQRTPHVVANKGIDDLTKIYPFSKFEMQVDFLSKLVRKEGLFVLHLTQYSFLDTKVSSKFSAYGNSTQSIYRLPVFDKNSRLVANPDPIRSIF